MTLPITFDFETQAIGPRPHYPPKPVGVAINIPGKKPKYYSFGAPTNNNCTEEEARHALAGVWHFPLLAHSMKFDYAVAIENWGLPKKPWHELHDSIFLLYLDNPQAPNFQLKSAAERYLGEPPDEQDAVRRWLIDHKVCRSNDKQWGRFICEAPGDLVGRYAIGDVTRTLGLYKLLMPKIRKEGMYEAYNRERELMPILLENERQGIRVDTGKLTWDINEYSKAAAKADEWLRKKLKSPDLNIDADQDLADALAKSKQVTNWVYTAPTNAHPEGVRSVAKDNLKVGMFKDPKVFSALGYRNRLKTSVGTFMQPWLTQAQQTGGTVHPNWNQVRGTEKFGTVTGRLSSSAPNFQNLPKNFEAKADGYTHPAFLDVPSLPLCRQYILPDEGGVYVHRDYNQQEFRLVGHYENGPLMEAYAADPDLDMHKFTQAEMLRIAALDLHRDPTKTANFLMLYGGGTKLLGEKINVSFDTAAKIKAAQKAALPGVLGRDGLLDQLKKLWRNGEPIVTYGGRLYYCEKSRDGKTFEYKALNYLAQGSAGDVTKQALINYSKLRQHGRLLNTVHDEINLSVPVEHVKTEMALLREAMESIPLDVFLKSDGKTGPSWSKLEKYID